MIIDFINNPISYYEFRQPLNHSHLFQIYHMGLQRNFLTMKNTSLERTVHLCPQTN